MTTLPLTMRALSMPFYDHERNNLILVEKTVPRPTKAHEVLIKIAASPINPSDVVFLEGRYGVKKQLPVTPGFEASGRVVATGNGLMARALMGRRVACGSPNDGDGTWAEYMVTRADSCMPLLPQITDEQGAMALANPMTAWGLMDLARRGGHNAIVQSGAAGAVGQMIARLGQRFKLPMIQVVRREEQVQQLQAMGEQYVLNSNAPDFEAQLRQLCRQLKVTLAFDAVAGPLSGQLLKAMPRHSHLVVYGGLSNKACVYDPSDIIFSHKKVTGFWLTQWLPRLSLAEKIKVGINVQRLLHAELKTEVQARLPLEAAAQGLRLYTQNMSAGKVLLLP